MFHGKHWQRGGLPEAKLNWRHRNGAGGGRASCRVTLSGHRAVLKRGGAAHSERRGPKVREGISFPGGTRWTRSWFDSTALHTPGVAGWETKRFSRRLAVTSNFKDFRSFAEEVQ